MLVIYIFGRHTMLKLNISVKCLQTTYVFSTTFIDVAVSHLPLSSYLLFLASFLFLFSSSSFSHLPLLLSFILYHLLHLFCLLLYFTSYSSPSYHLFSSSLSSLLILFFSTSSPLASFSTSFSLAYWILLFYLLFLFFLLLSTPPVYHLPILSTSSPLSFLKQFISYLIFNICCMHFLLK